MQRHVRPHSSPPLVSPSPPPFLPTARLQIARDVGLRVSMAEVGCEHIKALFTSPRLIFRLLHDESGAEGTGDGPNVDALHGLVHGL